MVKRSYCKNMDFIIWNILIVIVALKITLVDGGCTRPLPGMDQTRYTKHLQIGITSRTEVEALDMCQQWGGQAKVLKSAYHTRFLSIIRRKRERGCLAGIFIREEKEKNSGDMGWLLSYVDRTVPEQCVQDALRALHPRKRRRTPNPECEHQRFLLCHTQTSGKASKKHGRILPFQSNPSHEDSPSVCRNSLQQRVLPFSSAVPKCDKSETVNNWEVIDWEQDSSCEWEMTNTGADLEIKIHPIGSLRTRININGDVDYLNVHTIRIKWGKHAKTGSEHSYGPYRHAGEIQVFHDINEKVGGKKHAIAFFISERQNPPNPAWAEFIPLARINCRSVGDTYTLTSPPSLRNLIGEDASRRDIVYLSHRLLEYTRYQGSTTTAPCEEYIWTVFKNHLYLSKAQFTQLRSIEQPYSIQGRRSTAAGQVACRTIGSMWER